MTTSGDPRTEDVLVHVRPNPGNGPPRHIIHAALEKAEVQ